MEIRGVKVIRAGDGEDGAGWARALEDGAWVAGSRVLKEEGGSWVRRATVLGRDVVVKCRPLLSLARRMKHAIGMGHGHKHWRGAGLLMRAGIATGRPLALLRAEVDGARCEVLVLEWVEGKTLLEVMDEVVRGVGPGVREQHVIARAAGGVVSRMLAGRAWNRDHKPSNLIVARGVGGVDIAVIDCVGVRPWPWMGSMDDMDASENMAAAMVIEPTGCGCAARRALWGSVMRGMFQAPAAERSEVVRLRALREWVERVRVYVALRGGPQPRVNPLADRRG